MTRLSKKTETISISLPSWMIELMDETCHRQDFSRSCFVRKSLKKYLLAKNDSPDLWESLYDRLIGG
jgi:metal-responsive CopG/Arc/MetJ family transcriptional regulator